MVVYSFTSNFVKCHYHLLISKKSKKWFGIYWFILIPFTSKIDGNCFRRNGTTLIIFEVLDVKDYCWFLAHRMDNKIIRLALISGLVVWAKMRASNRLFTRTLKWLLPPPFMVWPPFPMLAWSPVWCPMIVDCQGETPDLGDPPNSALFF